MRKITFILIAFFLVSSLPGWSQVFITELADPNNNAGVRYIELFNAGPTAVDFTEGSGWRIDKYTNASTTVSQTLGLTGSIPSEGFYIIATGTDDGDFFSVYGVYADQFDGIDNGPAGSNGDDNLELYDGTNTLVDQFGVPGEDGTGKNHEFEDGRAERKAGITSGNSLWDFTEWNIWNDTGGGGTTSDPQDAPDDFDPGSWIGAVAGPVISVSPNSLSGFSYVEAVGGPSASQSFTVEGADLTADITVTPSTNYEISTDDVTFQLTPITLTQSGGTVATTTIYTRLQASLSGGNYDENITCSSTDATDQYVACSGTVEAPATTTLPYSQTFDADFGDCYTYSVSGATEVWSWGEYGGNGFAEINGYNTGDTETDWLILPGVNMDAYVNEYLTFDMWWQYGTDDASNYLKLYYSADYPGIGDPTSYTWTEVSYTQGAATTWTNSGLIDVSGVTGTNVYFGFKYNYEPVNYRWWELDNIALFEAANIDVTFQVNMEDQTVGGGVYIAGEFNGWNSTANPMTDVDMDNIYEATITLLEGVNYEYKFINGTSWENVPNECAQNGNRFEVVGSANYSIDPVCFGSCQDCGTPEWNITFRVDMKNETVTGDVYIAGDFNSWSDGLMTNTSGTVYEATILLEEGATYEYKFKNGSGGWENFSGSCTVGGGYGNRYVLTPANDATLDLVCFNSCDACPVADFVMINEVDADTPGTDVAEFVELYDGGVGNTDLSGLVVVMYNGSGDASYAAYDLDGYSTDVDGYFLMGNTDVVPTPALVFGSNGLQNGADAVALYIGDDIDFPNGTAATATNIVDALVYDTDDSDDSGLLDVLTPGQPQINERGRGDGDNHSNQRIPNGSGGLLVTSTYDQSPPTPGAENVGIYTDWTGASDDAWDNDDNWTNTWPDNTQNATIPASATTFPMIYVEGAECNNLYIESGASLDISAYGTLTVGGTFTNAGTLSIYSNEEGTGSLITSSSVPGSIQRYFTGNDIDWHLVSSPVAGAQADVFMGMYMQSFDNTTYAYTDIEDETTLLNVMEGYALYSTLGADNTATFSGTLNAGTQSATISTGADSYNWNLLGNPYPSSIDWEAVTIPANMTNEVHYIMASTGGDASYVKGVGGVNGGSQYIPPMQGFFVSATGGDVLQFDDGMRSHTNSALFYKDETSHLILTASNENFSDETMIHFNENAGVEHDGQYDAFKRLSGSNPELPQIFSITPAGTKLAINGLQATEQVAIGFNALSSGSFTINASQSGDFSTLLLEDLVTGTITDLNVTSYSFDYAAGEPAHRFNIHFAPLSVNTATASNINVYSFNNEIVVRLTDATDATVEVFNMLGQPVLTTEVSENVNNIQLNETGNYVVRIKTDAEVISQKVTIK